MTNPQMANNQLREMESKNTETLEVYIKRNGVGMIAHAYNPAHGRLLYEVL